MSSTTTIEVPAEAAWEVLRRATELLVAIQPWQAQSQEVRTAATYLTIALARLGLDEGP